VSTDDSRLLPTIEALKALEPCEFQNWVIDAAMAPTRPRKVGDMGIDGQWFLTRERCR
jgi:hypothetical protein